MFFHFQKEKDHLWLQTLSPCYRLSGFQLHVSAVAKRALVKMTVNTFAFVTWGVEGDQTCLCGGIRTCMYVMSVDCFQGRPWGNNGHCTNMFVYGKERGQTKQKTAQGKAGIGERLGLRQSAGAILESLSTVNGSCSILKCILMALEFRHFINTRKKTWENADWGGGWGQKILETSFVVLMPAYCDDWA